VAFPPKLLIEGEEVVLDLHPHGWFFSGPLVALVLAVAATIAVVALNLPDLLLYVLLGLVAINALWLLGRLAKWSTTNFVLTTDRLIYRSGVVAKKGKEIPLERLNDISFNQTVFERILGAGDLVIESGGERGQQSFTDIPTPSRVQNEIYRQIELSQARDADRLAGRRDLSVPEQLEKLDELRRRGVLSNEEFESQKARLLGSS
jgi:uncharacterized membrane protein YdbT with pleckstrin-like domain